MAPPLPLAVDETSEVFVGAATAAAVGHRGDLRRCRRYHLPWSGSLSVPPPSVVVGEVFVGTAVSSAVGEKFVTDAAIVSHGGGEGGLGQQTTRRPVRPQSSAVEGEGEVFVGAVGGQLRGCGWS